MRQVLGPGALGRPRGICGFMSMYGKNHYNIVISLKLIKINGKYIKNKMPLKTINRQ